MRHAVLLCLLFWALVVTACLHAHKIKAQPQPQPQTSSIVHTPDIYLYSAPNPFCLPFYVYPPNVTPEIMKCPALPRLPEKKI